MIVAATAVDLARLLSLDKRWCVPATSSPQPANAPVALIIDTFIEHVAR